MSGMKDVFDQQAERGRSCLEHYERLATGARIHDDDYIYEIAANAIADILHAVAQSGHDFRKIGTVAIGWAEESGADLYADGGVRVGA